VKGQRDRGIIAVTFLLAAAVCMAWVASGCGASARQRDLSAAMRGVDAAAAGFVSWDGDHQMELVQASHTKELGAAALASYRQHQVVVVDGIKTAYRAIAAAALGTGDVAGALAAAAQAYHLIREIEASP
jgi:hypothetical protein